MKKMKHQRKVENSILSLLSHHQKTGLSFKGILHSLNVSGLNRHSLKMHLQRMEGLGLIRKKGKSYRLNPETTKDEVTESGEFLEGTLEQNKHKTLVLSHESLSSPVKIYPENSRDALPGDRVRVKIKKRRATNTHVGKVVRILERQGVSFVFQVINGEVHSRMEFSLPVRLEIPEGLTNKSFHRARITEHIHARYYQARYLEEVKEGIDIDIEDLVGRHRVPHHFSQKLIESINQNPTEVCPRLDLRELVCFTIDGADSKDFDDAISVKRSDAGYILYVHIADVSHYVREGTPIDVQARERGTSIYFPRYVIPMLPEILSNELCSLNPDVDRFAFSCEMHIDKSGKLKKAFTYPSQIRSNRRFTYENFQELHDSKKSKDPISKEVEIAYELYQILLKTRKKRGAIDFDLPEPRLILDDFFRITEITNPERLDSHKLIEEFMVLTNVVMAQFAKQAGLPILFRHHPPPKNDSLSRLKQIMEGLEVEFPKLNYKTPKAYQKLLAGMDPEKSKFIQPMVIRTMEKAIYHESNPDHFGLSLQFYSHFTSPIRRYPDLVLHRQLRKLIASSRGIKLPLRIFPLHDASSNKLALKQTIRGHSALARQCSDRERRAVDLERDYKRRKMTAYMQKFVGHEFQARVTGVIARGVFCEIVGNFAEGFLPFDKVPGHWVGHDQKQLAECKSDSFAPIRLGDRLLIEVFRVDEDENQVDFRLSPDGIKELRERLEEIPGPKKKKNLSRGKKRRRF